MAFDNTTRAIKLTWTPYEGSQPFAEYWVLRNLADRIKVDTLAHLHEVSQTSFVDSSLRFNANYVYRVSVVNASGFEAPSQGKNNPAYTAGFDPELTPAVELLSVTVDSTSGSATLEWSPYAGQQPFAEYRVLRQVRERVAVDTLVKIPQVQQTTFRDTTPQPGVVYGYWVEVVNQAGFSATSENQGGVAYALPSIELLAAEFSSDTATAELVWTQYRGPGFKTYQVRRKAPGLDEEVVAEVEDVSDTTYTDSLLDGNTEYTYHIFVSTIWGESTGVFSNEKSGLFHLFDHGFNLPETPDAEPRAVGLAVDEQDQFYIARTMRETRAIRGGRPMKRGVQVYFPGTGPRTLFSETRPDLESPIHMVAGQGRVYVSVRSGSGMTLIAVINESEQKVKEDSVDTDGAFPVGLYLEKDGEVIMLDNRNYFYRFGPEGQIIQKSVPATGAIFELFSIITVGQGVVGRGVGFEGGDHFFFLTPEQRDYHVFAITRLPETKWGFRDATSIPIDTGIGIERGQTLNPVALAFDPQRQRLLVLEAQGRLQVFDGRYDAHRYITQWGRVGTGEGEFLIFHPTGAAMAVDSQGIIYVADGSGRVQVFAP